MVYCDLLLCVGLVELVGLWVFCLILYGCVYWCWLCDWVLRMFGCYLLLVLFGLFLLYLFVLGCCRFVLGLWWICVLVFSLVFLLDLSFDCL